MKNFENLPRVLIVEIHGELIWSKNDLIWSY